MLLFLELLDLLYHVSSSVLCLKLFAHGEGHRRLVQRLVRGLRPVYIVANTKQEKAALWQVQGHLSDDFIETLSEELLTYGTDASIAGLALEHLLIKHLSQSCHIDPGSVLMADILDEVLALLDPLARLDDMVEHLVS